MKVFSTLSPKSRSNLLRLFLAGMLFWCSIGSLLGTLPLYIQHVGGSPQDVGIVIGSFSIGLLLSRRPLGQMADIRSRKIVLLIGISVVAIAPLGYLLFQSIPVLMAVRAFHGISISAQGIAYLALVADISPPQHRGEIIGYMLLVAPLGVAIGPAVGGALTESFGYEPLFLLTSGFGLLSLVCGLLVREPSVPQTERKRTSSPRTDKFWSLLLSQSISIPTLVLLLAALAFAARTTFVPLFIKDTGVDLNPGWFYTASAIAGFCTRLGVGPGSARFGRGLFISISLLLYSLGMLTLWTLPLDARGFLIAGIIEGSGFGMIIPSMSALIADRCHPHERGRIFSLCLGGFDLGIAIAGPVFGTIADLFNYPTLFGFATAIAFINLIIFTTMSGNNLSHSLRYALGRGKDVYAID
ncbi:MAG: MFS transporter [Hormoscilla sp.]